MNEEDRSVNDLPDETKASIRNSFLRLRFQGGRFGEDGSMPLSALQELVYFQELVDKLAPKLVRQHLNRSRLTPESQPQKSTLRVSGFVAGSTIPVVENVVDPGNRQGDFFAFDPHEASLDLITKTFFSIIDFNRIPDEFPADLLPDLEKIGSALIEGESESFIEVDDDHSLVAKTWTQETRKRFWDSQKVITRSSKWILGRIVSLEKSGVPSFTFRDELSGQKVTGPCGVHWGDLYEALDKSDTGRYWRLYAEVEHNHEGKLLRIIRLDSVEVLEMKAEHWNQRFKELATSEIEIDSVSLERTDQIITEIELAGIVQPAIFPSGEGGVDIVWDTPKGRITVYVEAEADYDVELVPIGPLVPYSTHFADQVVGKVREYLGGLRIA